MDNKIKADLTASKEIDISVIDKIIKAIGTERDKVIPILIAVQKELNYLPERAVLRICEKTDITPAQVYGVSTFYSQFRHKPAGRYKIKVCIGTACHVKGAETVFNAFKSFLKIEEDKDTDAKKLFTIEKVACLGCCMLAPAVQIDTITYGFLNTQKVPNVIRDFLESQKRNTNGEKKIRENEKKAFSSEIRICVCSSCQAAGAEKVYKELKLKVLNYNIPAKVKIVGCTGISYEAPLVEIHLQNNKVYRYGRVKPKGVKSILFEHFKPKNLKYKIKSTIDHILERILTGENPEPATRYYLDME